MKQGLSIDSLKIKKHQNKSIDKLLLQQAQSINKKNTLNTTTDLQQKHNKIQLKPYKSLSIDTTLPVENTLQSIPSQSSISSWRKITPSRKRTPITLNITSIDQTTHKYSQSIDQVKRLSEQLLLYKQKFQNRCLELKQANQQITSLKAKIECLQKDLQSLSIQSSKPNTDSLVFENLKKQFQSQQSKNKILQKELTVLKQINLEYKTSFKGNSLMNKMEGYIREIQQKKMQSKYYQQQYEQLKSNRDKKRKERDQRHRQEMTTLSSQILRMNNQLYAMRTNSKINSGSNQESKQVIILLSQQQSIINTLQSIIKNKQSDYQLIKLLKSKHKYTLSKDNNKQTLISKHKILSVLNKLRCQGFDIKYNHKTIPLLREIQQEIQNLFQLII